MIVYFDTSALVATYVPDVCTVQARKTRETATRIATSMLTYAETLATFAMLHRVGRLKAGERRRVEAAFLVEWAEFQRTRVEQRLLPDVRRILLAHPLKGADAVHLASASLVARGCATAGIDYRFACDDRALAAAATAEGLSLAW